METNTILNAQEALEDNQVLKLSALQYFQEALKAQAYEHCAELAAMARKFGAAQADVSAVIAAHLRGDGPPGLDEAKPWKNRLRSLKEEK